MGCCCCRLKPSNHRDFDAINEDGGRHEHRPLIGDGHQQTHTRQQQSHQQTEARQQQYHTQARQQQQQPNQQTHTRQQQSHQQTQARQQQSHQYEIQKRQQHRKHLRGQVNFTINELRQLELIEQLLQEQDRQQQEEENRLQQQEHDLAEQRRLREPQLQRRLEFESMPVVMRGQFHLFQPERELQSIRREHRNREARFEELEQQFGQLNLEQQQLLQQQQQQIQRERLQQCVADELETQQQGFEEVIEQLLVELDGQRQEHERELQHNNQMGQRLRQGEQENTIRQMSLELEQQNQQEIEDLQQEQEQRPQHSRHQLQEETLPENWSPMDTLFKLVELEEGSQEFVDVFAKFNCSYLLALIKIERIQNISLFQQFMVQKKHVEDQLHRYDMQGTEVTKILFHGTTEEAMQSICESGFDRSYSGCNDTAYGEGVYFASSSDYADFYAEDDSGIRRMFVAEVITGHCCLGHKDMRHLPKVKDEVDYHCAVDNVQNPTKYVVFKDASAYPLYIITYL